MCGIVGYITPTPTEEHLVIFKKMLEIDSSRGADATGFMFPSSGGGIVVYKDNILPKELIASFDKWEISPWMVGHNRLKTLGTELKNINNHPVISGGFALVHNGNVRPLGEINLPVAAEVDSQRIVEIIANQYVYPNVIDAIKTVPTYVSGSYACVVSNAKQPTKLWLFRNYVPMQLVYLPKMNTLLFGSDKDILLGAVTERKDFLGGLFERLTVPKFATTDLGARDILEIDTRMRWTRETLISNHDTYLKKVGYSM